MSNAVKYYRYEGYSYRVEEDSEGKPVAAYILQLDGTWAPSEWGWQTLSMNDLPISEEEAFVLAGIKTANPDLSPIPATTTAPSPAASQNPSSSPNSQSTPTRGSLSKDEISNIDSSN